jgi:CTP:molybdopterin cytidylyltransferase MocA
MPGFKPLAEIGGKTLVEHVVRMFHQAGVVDVVVVVGHRAEELVTVLDSASVRWVMNERYRDEMYHSIGLGAGEVKGRCDAFFVLPVDIPLVRSITVQKLMEAFSRRTALVCHPVSRSGRGHPPVIDSSLIEDLVTWQGKGGLKAFMDRYTERSENVRVADDWIRKDVDSEEDFIRLRREFEKYAIPSVPECLDMMIHYLDVPQAVLAHGRAVARVAERLGSVLNTAGGHLDIRLLKAAGLLHDAFKGQDDHAGLGAAWLRESGFPEVAAIVADHMNLAWHEGDTVDERALLYLADKVLEGEKIVPLEKRRSAVLKKHGHNDEARRNIAARLDTAKVIQTTVEEMAGRDLPQILGDL